MVTYIDIVNNDMYKEVSAIRDISKKLINSLEATEVYSKGSFLESFINNLIPFNSSLKSLARGIKNYRSFATEKVEKSQFVYARKLNSMDFYKKIKFIEKGSSHILDTQHVVLVLELYLKSASERISDSYKYKVNPDIFLEMQVPIIVEYINTISKSVLALLVDKKSKEISKTLATMNNSVILTDPDYPINEKLILLIQTTKQLKRDLILTYKIHDSLC